MGQIQSAINSLTGTIAGSVLGSSILKKKSQMAEQNKDTYSNLYKTETAKALGRKNLTSEQIAKIADMENNAIKKAKFEQEHADILINSVGKDTDKGRQINEREQKRSNANIRGYRKSLKETIKGFDQAKSNEANIRTNNVKNIRFNQQELIKMKKNILKGGSLNGEQ